LNSFWKDGKLIPSYRQPFDIIIDMNTARSRNKGEKMVNLCDFEQSYP